MQVLRAHFSIRVRLSIIITSLYIIIMILGMELILKYIKPCGRYIQVICVTVHVLYSGGK